jgi:hypothetical protein
MSETMLNSAPAIAEWLGSHLRKGDGLSRPYARRWENAGRAATKFLWAWPADRLSDLANSLNSLGRPVVGTPDGVRVELPSQPVWVSANRSNPGDGPPDAYVVRLSPDALPAYIGNSPEVVGELLRGLELPSYPPDIGNEEVQVGFPGVSVEPTYVGSWQWDIHGEARGDESIKRAASATIAAIETRRDRG